MKKIIFILTIILISPVILPAKDFNRGKLPRAANPDWIYPSNRKNYDGYEKKRQKQLNNPDWKHSTNRDTGKNRGGGTIYYYDYQSIRQRTSAK
jgi:hypothetical protein